jgi:SAM-dependent methyltransferase
MIGNLHGSIVFDRRTRVLAQRLGALMPRDAVVLDVGCGDGTIDALVCEVRPDVRIEGIDVLVRPSTKVPVRPFDGVTFPWPDKSADVVMFVDVLHHTLDPTNLLREAKRVARRLIVIKDHRMEAPFASATLRFMDWVGNAPHGVALPYNYWPEKQWRSAFTALDLRISHWQSRLGLYPFPASLVFERGLHFIAALEP